MSKLQALHIRVGDRETCYVEKLRVVICLSLTAWLHHQRVKPNLISICVLITAGSTLKEFEVVNLGI